MSRRSHSSKRSLCMLTPMRCFRSWPPGKYQYIHMILILFKPDLRPISWIIVYFFNEFAKFWFCKGVTGLVGNRTRVSRPANRHPRHFYYKFEFLLFMNSNLMPICSLASYIQICSFALRFLSKIIKYVDETRLAKPLFKINFRRQVCNKKKTAWI